MENSTCLTSTGKNCSFGLNCGLQFCSIRWMEPKERTKNLTRTTWKLERDSWNIEDEYLWVPFLDQYAAAYKLTSINYLQCFGFSIDHIRVGL